MGGWVLAAALGFGSDHRSNGPGWVRASPRGLAFTASLRMPWVAAVCREPHRLDEKGQFMCWCLCPRRKEKPTQPESPLPPTSLWL